MLKGDFKTFSPFQSLLILNKPYFDLLSNSSKKLNRGDLDFIWGNFNSFPCMSFVQWGKDFISTKLETQTGDLHGKILFPPTPEN
jgi:hypothetical protein